MFTVSTWTIPLDVYIVNILVYNLFMPEAYHHGNLRAALIEGGIKMLNRDGIAAFSLRKLSQELGVSHTAAYRHFSSKEELFRAIFSEVASNFRNALARAILPEGAETDAPEPSGNDNTVAGTGDSRADRRAEREQDRSGERESARRHRALIRLGIGYVRFFRDHPEYVPLFALMHSSSPVLADLFPAEPADSEIARDGKEAFEIFRGLVDTVREEEYYRDLGENEILLGFWAKVHGLALLIVAHPEMIPPDRFEESVSRIMLTRF